MKSIALMALSVAAVLAAGTLSAEAKHKSKQHHASHHAHGTYQPEPLSVNGGWRRGPDEGWPRGDLVLGLGGFGIVTGFGPWGGTYTDPYAWDPYFIERDYHGFGRPYGQNGYRGG